MKEMLIDDLGRHCSSSRFELEISLDYPKSDFDIIQYAVRNLGYIHLVPLSTGLLVKFRPAVATREAVVAAYFAIAESRPRRVVLSYVDNGRHHREIVDGFGIAQRRMEHLCSADRPLARPIFDARRVRMDRLGSVPGSRLQTAYRIWLASRGNWNTDLPQAFDREQLLDRCVIAQMPPGSERLLVAHRGKGFAHYGRRWSNSAIGRDLEDQPDRHYGKWVASEYRKTLGDDAPTLESVEAVIQTRARSETRQSSYHRLLLPWRSADGGRVITSMSILRKTAILD